MKRAGSLTNVLIIFVWTLRLTAEVNTEFNNKCFLRVLFLGLCLLFWYLHIGVFCDSRKISEIFPPQIRYVENSGSAKLDSIVLCQFMANS